MFYYSPYLLVIFFILIATKKGHSDYRTKSFWIEIGASLALMFVVRDIFYLLGVIT
jgi:hypothetical protein